MALRFATGDVRVADVRTGSVLLDFKDSSASQTWIHLTFEAEPGASDGVLHYAQNSALRVWRRERLAVFAALAAPKRSPLREAFLNKSGDHRVLVKVLGWMIG